MRPKDNEYVFYDGPPFPTGSPHVGTLLASVIKDMVPRYWTMRGFRVERRFGWDTHGLPIEMQVERQLGISGPQEIAAYGIDRFNEACRALVTTNTENWSRVIRRVGPLGRHGKRLQDHGHLVHGKRLVGLPPTVGQGTGLPRLQGDALLLGRRHPAFQLRSEPRIPGHRRPFDHGASSRLSTPTGRWQPAIGC